MSLHPISNSNYLFYGDETRWFIGVVEDILDPLKQGRIKVRIVGVHTPDKSKIPTADLPWAMVASPITHSGTSGLWGTPVGIKPSAQVFGVFLDGGHSQSPLVLGVIPKVEQPPPGGGKYTGQSYSTPPGVGPNGTPSQQTPSVGVATPVIGGSAQERVYNYLEAQFRAAGHENSREIAAGFVGNLMVETNGINPASRPGDNGTAYGIAQWRFDRLTGLDEFARGQPNVTYVSAERTGRQMPDLDTQIRYIWHELQTTERNAYSQIIGSTSAADAARRIDRYYERSDGTKREQRAVNANAVYDAFTNGES